MSSDKAHSFDEKVPADTSSAEYIHSDLRNLDVGFKYGAGHADDAEVTREEAARLRRKCDWHLLPLLCAIYTVQFIDKGSLASTSILGFIKDNHLTTDDFNTLSSAFYIGYLAFEYPQNWALQRLPVGKWITFNILLWCLFLGLHTVAHSFGSLFILRFLLGASEGCMTSGLMLIVSMFYTRTEIGERLGWVFSCNGLAVIISGFLSFGAFHAKANGHPNQYQWLFISTTILSFLTFVAFVLWFPDNPTTARFLTEAEKERLVKRVQVNQNGIETKSWKRAQFIEALTDVKTWLFFFFGGFAALQGGIGVQYSIIIQSFGFTTLQTTLLNIPSGFAQIIGIFAGCYALRKFPNSRAYIGVVSLTPSFISAIIQLGLPFHNKIGHLVGIYLLYLGSSPCFIMAMSWVTSTVSGHTKRTTTNAIFLIGYSLGQICCTQFWKQKYRPRNLVPWGITLMSWIMVVILLLAVRFVLNRENKRRDVLQAQAEAAAAGGHIAPEFDDFAYVDTVDAQGNSIKARVEKGLLDITDKENLAFRYVL